MPLSGGTITPTVPRTSSRPIIRIRDMGMVSTQPIIGRS
jgi:hypothetical protein